jgi:hypothetical protein
MKGITASGFLTMGLLAGTVFSAPIPRMYSGGSSYGNPTQVAGVDLTADIPAGNLADGMGFGLGALGRYEYCWNGGFGVTARAGYLYHIEKNSVAFSQIPILGGVKYNLMGMPLYLGAEIGAIMLGSMPSSGSSNWDTNLGWDIGAGYGMRMLNFRVAVKFLDASKMSDNTAVAVDVGYNFWSI